MSRGSTWAILNFKFSNFYKFSNFFKFSNFLWFPAFVWLSDIFYIFVYICVYWKLRQCVVSTPLFEMLSSSKTCWSLSGWKRKVIIWLLAHSRHPQKLKVNLYYRVVTRPPMARLAPVTCLLQPITWQSRHATWHFLQSGASSGRTEGHFLEWLEPW